MLHRCRTKRLLPGRDVRMRRLPAIILSNMCIQLHVLKIRNLAARFNAFFRHNHILTDFQPSSQEDYNSKLKHCQFEF